MKRKYEIRSAIFFTAAVVYWCFVLFAFAYLAEVLDLKKDQQAALLMGSIWIIGTAVLIVFGIVNLARARINHPQAAIQMAVTSHPAPQPRPPHVRCNINHLSDKQMLEQLITKLKAGEINNLPWIYTFVTSPDPDIVKTAAAALANYVDTVDPKYLISFDEQFRSYTSVEWSIDWSRVDIERMEKIIDDEKTFLWIMRIGTFSPNGFYREKCIRRLHSDPGSYIFLLIRLRDWVLEVRNASKKACYDISSLDFHELVNCLSALEKVKRSERVDAFYLRELETRISERIAKLSPGFEKVNLKRYDVPTRRVLYRILLENNRLTKDEVRTILNSENQAQCLYYIMSLYIEKYDLTAEELDEYIDHKSASVQRRAIEQKYKLMGNSWPGLENKLLSPSAPVRELTRFILKKHDRFDCRKFYIEHLDSSDRKACIAGLGETGLSEDAALLMPFLEDPDASIVKVTLHALGSCGGESLSEVFWKYLQDERENVAMQAFREITKLNIRYGSKQIYELFQKTDSDILKIKLVYRLSHETYWDRIPYALMLYSHSDETIRHTVRHALVWNNAKGYSSTTEENAKFITAVLNDDKYEIDEKVKKAVLFNLEHTGRKPGV